MTVNRRYGWIAAALAGLLLVFLWWDGDKPAPFYAKKGETDPAIERFPSSPHAQVRKEECEGCPDTPQVGWQKRAPGPNNMVDCQEFLADAANAGNPSPDTSHLEDCSGWSPLHFAETPQQVQMLLDAGADPNIQDLEGRTPLYLQIEKAMAMPSDNGSLIVQKLLDAEADPWLKTNSGKLPWDVARSNNTSGARFIQGENRLRRHLRDKGMTLEEAFEKHPALKTAMDEEKRAPQIASQTLAALMDAMRRTEPRSVREEYEK